MSTVSPSLDSGRYTGDALNRLVASCIKRRRHPGSACLNYGASVRPDWAGARDLGKLGQASSGVVSAGSSGDPGPDHTVSVDSLAGGAAVRTRRTGSRSLNGNAKVSRAGLPHLVDAPVRDREELMHVPLYVAPPEGTPAPLQGLPRKLRENQKRRHVVVVRAHPLVE